MSIPTDPHVSPRDWLASTFARCLLFLAWVIPAKGLCAIEAESERSGDQRPNVLFIMVDDLRPELGCYGATHVKSPRIDRLASTGRRFERAYCQQAVCNPSRTSLLTGRRPDAIGVIGNHSHFRSIHPDVATLPEHFKRNGYHTQSIGKIFHGVFPKGASKTPWDTMGDPESWSVPTTRFGPRYYYTEDGIRQAKQAYLDSYRPTNPGDDDWAKRLVFGPMTESPDVSDDTLYDGKVARAAVDTLNRLATEKGTPFFLAVGFIKPHTPFVAPQKYWGLYDRDEIVLATDQTLPSGAPKIAGHSSGEVRRYTDQPKRGPFSDENQRQLRHGYFACISYIDAQIGRVLDELDRLSLSQDTIVVLLGDHGWHLGEHGLWGKTTNFELDTRVPLIIRTPDMARPGAASDSLVELVDLYPTLVDLAGLESPDQLDGISLTPILGDPGRSVKQAALSQYPRGGKMGYSLRTKDWRLTQWIERASGLVTDTELYDHRSDPGEASNVAGRSEQSQTVRQLSRELTKRFKLASVRPSTQAGHSATGFEEAAPGPFTDLELPIGRWTAQQGHCEIDRKHHYRGQQCLHLLGGDQRSVELQPADRETPIGQISFQAERWTRRSPFSFRVEALVGDQWSEIYDGDKKLQVGTFKTAVRIDVAGKPVRRLRLTSTSPAGSGVLIDEFRLEAAQPQRVTSVASEPITLPALIGTVASPLARIRIDVEGSQDPITLSSMSVNLLGTTDFSDVEAMHVFSTGSQRSLRASDDPDCFANATRFGEQTRPDANVTFSGEMTLSPGVNYLWVAATMNDDANIDHVVAAACESVSFSNGTTHDFQPAVAPQRMGVAVRKRNDDGVHTCRIPGLATTNDGTLIAVYDVRRRGGGDLPGDIDVGMSRSVDGGRTWQPMRVIMDQGSDPEWRYDGIGDPAILVDQTTGTIWVAATWSHGNRSWFGSGPGLAPEQTGQLMLVSSDDDGVTWSKPINITSQVKRPEWCFLLQGPGKGITMADGTIVFAAQYQDPEEKKRLPHSTIIYSRDHGRTWHVGTGAFDDTTESQVVELEPGRLMLNCRYNRAPARVVTTTTNLGQTWQVHPTSQRSLIEPRACMASLINVDRELVGRHEAQDTVETGEDADHISWLLFSNPDSTAARERIMIKASADGGHTWPRQNRLLLDEGRGAGYSCLTMIDRETVGILYEGSLAQMTFQRIPLKQIVGDQPARVTPGDGADGRAGGLRLPRVFGDHMVVQADVPAVVWGKARPNGDVTVTFGRQQRATTADQAGDWRVSFAPRRPTFEPNQIMVRSGGDSIILSDVVVGEVWVCAGQSNMAWPLEKTENGTDAVASASKRKIRLLHLVGGADGSSGRYDQTHLSRLTPERFCEGQWKPADADSARGFSAVAWYFGETLGDELEVPVGLICPAVGGTPIESWIPAADLESDSGLANYVHGDWLVNDHLGEFCRERGMANLRSAIQSGLSVPSDRQGPNHAFKPGFMWHAAVEPIIPLAIRGAIWYQGESNAGTSKRVNEYGKLFPLMIRRWRDEWGLGDFPVLYAQLPAMGRDRWPEFRDLQRRMLGACKNVSMAVTIDTGHPTNVHPRLKKPVGQRLARLALADVYGDAAMLPASGPMFRSGRAEGDAIILQFDHVGDKLATSDEQSPRHFEVCGVDGRFVSAEATIRGNEVVVASPRVVNPVDARYAWRPFPTPPVNFCNSAGLPASPFTTESPHRD